ncbi:hypothetical protein D9758_000818 [Tetrapyrgos nigripes]|uniref:Uncharacterized protein n=1 Tax=Tetrapyrgos nigripes TaxID=182062 RepID=A0A8H5LYA5_9AGAR|nr:hypothetical protein D9758_000818 [Tetrapyrgos nigripes]
MKGASSFAVSKPKHTVYKKSPLARSQSSLDLEREIKAENKRRREQANETLNLEEEMDYEEEIERFHAKWAAIAELLEKSREAIKDKKESKAPVQNSTSEHIIIPFEREIEIGF